MSKPTTDRPPKIAGMRHVALCVKDIQASEKFYVDLLGYVIEWQPDDHNVYLTCGVDNLALHQSEQAEGAGALDHIGIMLNTPADVDAWFKFLKSHHVKIRTEPKTHRDGARSFYCYDPDGVQVQMIYHPPLANQLSS